jgi:hypothetical protein
MRVTVPTPVANPLIEEMVAAGYRVKRIPQPDNQTEVVLQASNDNLDNAFAFLNSTAKDMAAKYEAETEIIEEIDDGRDSEPDPTPSGLPTPLADPAA